MRRLKGRLESEGGRERGSERAREAGGKRLDQVSLSETEDEKKKILLGNVAPFPREICGLTLGCVLPPAH